MGAAALVVDRQPNPSGLICHNEVVTGEEGSGDQVDIFGMEYSPTQYYRGSVPKGDIFKVQAALPDPPLLIKASLEKILNPREGVEIGEGKRASTTEVYTHASCLLKELLKEMNLHSTNLYAEHLLKKLGEGSGERGSRRLGEFLSSLGIDSQIRDGAGLARANLLTPQGVVKLLMAVAKVENFLQEFDGLGAIVKAKTGTMSNIHNLAGYIELPSGKKYAFAIFCNNYVGPTEEIREEIRYFLKELTLQL